MSPSKCYKTAAPYAYYVSQSVLQQRRWEAGTVQRVSAVPIEDTVVDALRRHFDPKGELHDRELVARHVERVVLHPQHLKVILRKVNDDSAVQGCAAAGTILTVPWIPVDIRVHKLKRSTDRPVLDSARAVLLGAIARARSWMVDLVEGRVVSLEAIAKRERKTVARIRALSALAFVSPRIVDAIADGRAPADLTVAALVDELPRSWAEQERKFGI